MTDSIMASFQAGACLFLIANIFAMKRDGELKGVSAWMIAFFTIWSFYGVYHWHVLAQPLSLITSAVMSVLYVIWLFQVVKSKLLRGFR